MNLPEPVFQQTTDNYFYDKRFINYLIQFMAIFDGMQVRIGKNDLGSSSDMIRVPIKHGSVDRVVQSILSDNTQNKPLRLPMFSARLSDIQIDEQAMHGTAVVHRKVFLPLGESLPDGLQVVRRRVPIPYAATFELAIYCSNLDQKYQILEQIGLLFDPILQIQTSDALFDWTKINTVELVSINLEENYPSAQDRRILVTTISFSTTIYLSGPINYKQDYIKSIQIRLDTISQMGNVNEVVKDVNRPDPPYEKLFDIDDYDVPKS